MGVIDDGKIKLVVFVGVPLRLLLHLQISGKG